MANELLKKSIEDKKSFVNEFDLFRQLSSNFDYFIRYLLNFHSIKFYENFQFKQSQ